MGNGQGHEKLVPCGHQAWQWDIHIFDFNMIYSIYEYLLWWIEHSHARSPVCGSTIIPFHFIPFHFISFHFIPFHSIFDILERLWFTIAYVFLVAQGPSASPGAHVARAFAAPRGRPERRRQIGLHGAAAVEEQLPATGPSGMGGWGNQNGLARAIVTCRHGCEVAMKIVVNSG